MMFSKNSVGLELTSAELRLVKVSHDKTPKVDLALRAPFSPGTLTISRREPNVTEPQEFVDRIRETYGQLAAHSSTICLSLPDACGRTMLLSVDAPFNNKAEGIDIIRWKLKKLTLPSDQLHLDYQVLAKRGDGSTALLVATIATKVVTQYEELLLQAGLEPKQIDFTSFNLHRLFAPRFELSADYAFLAHYEGVMAVMIFHDGVLEFYRSKAVAHDNLHREISSTFSAYREQSQRSRVTEVFCITDWADAAAFSNLVTGACGLAPKKLEVRQTVTFGKGAEQIDQPAWLAGSLGAALRRLR